MKIRNANLQDLDEMAVIFSDVFSKASDDKWTEESAKKYLEYCYNRRPDLMFVAVDAEKIIGGVFGEIYPLWDGQTLGEIEIFVNFEYQKSGLGKLLLKKIINEAKEKYQVINLGFSADMNKEFPMSWYSKIGMKKSSWILMSGSIDEVLRNLEK
ncbi:MAG: GNAT family N-acetyltransferase [Candidatus Berkelbacteria bacterium]